eukprot:TRINITY_DN17459_c0_g1_i2.p1 TRINITY_DN17459_c0_g1~~TRINITY_DN17459_c0_g1_i2.p1  ORF type:complete len:1123 (-),score=304.08 TRINITY_DN17459_c0_g1_i2:199-3567(-)
MTPAVMEPKPRSRGHAPGSFPSKPSGFLVDINMQGRLVEKHRDPLLQLVDAGTQTQAGSVATATKKTRTTGKRSSTMMGLSPETGEAEQTAVEPVLSRGPGYPELPSTAGCTLKLAAGLLGLEAHEKPSNWAEVWLSFQDNACAGANLGLGGQTEEGEGGEDGSPKSQSPEDDSKLADKKRAGAAYIAEQKDWQLRVLEKLRRHVGTKEGKAAGGLSLPGKPCSDLGPDFAEHLDLAEHILGRITQAVSALQSPERHERPLVLQGYTQTMADNVCTDVRQWMEQLGNLVSLYHIHLMDLDHERAELEKALEQERGRNDDCDRRCSEAENRHQALKDHWEEDKMKRSAAELLGLEENAADTRFIYTEEDLQRAMKDWERESLLPLLEENRELKIKVDDLTDKLKKQMEEMKKMGRANSGRFASNITPEEIEVMPAGAISAESVAVLTKVVSMLSDKTAEDQTGQVLVRLAEVLEKNGDKLQDELKRLQAEVQRLKKPARPSTPEPQAAVVQDRGLKGADEAASKKAKEQEQALKAAAMAASKACECLGMLAGELDGFERKSRTGPFQKISPFATWLRDTVRAIDRSLKPDDGKGKIGLMWKPSPGYDLTISDKKPSTSAFGCQVDAPKPTQTAAAPVVQQEVRSETVQDPRLQAEIDRLKAEMEKIKQNFKDQLDAERAKYKAIIAELEAALAAAEARCKALRSKLLELERLMKQRGLGKDLAECMQEAGLSEYLETGDVFERLYKDALDRMKRFAEQQMRSFQENQEKYLRLIEGLYGSAIMHNNEFIGIFVEQEQHHAAPHPPQGPAQQMSMAVAMAGLAGQPYPPHFLPEAGLRIIGEGRRLPSKQRLAAQMGIGQDLPVAPRVASPGGSAQRAGSPGQAQHLSFVTGVQLEKPSRSARSRSPFSDGRRPQADYSPARPPQQPLPGSVGTAMPPPPGRMARGEAVADLLVGSRFTAGPGGQAPPSIVGFAASPTKTRRARVESASRSGSHARFQGHSASPLAGGVLPPLQSADGSPLTAFSPASPPREVFADSPLRVERLGPSPYASYMTPTTASGSMSPAASLFHSGSPPARGGASLLLPPKALHHRAMDPGKPNLFVGPSRSQNLRSPGNGSVSMPQL